ncbi:calcium-binding protein [Sorangium sp. So ce1099]|uniref:calcium-binding protein n=1 Tax=Sorangium sp. So ce1099 TaxID=3133331 RepID=UPI003F5D97B5
MKERRFLAILALTGALGAASACTAHDVPLEDILPHGGVDPVTLQATGADAEDGEILGTPGDDKLVGTAADDVILGLDGNDTVSGNDGLDFLRGDGGDDVLAGGRGSDFCYGGTGRDYIYAGSDSDELHGEEGDDVLKGEWGDDTLYGGPGADVLDGDAGDDALHGGHGGDIYYIDLFALSVASDLEFNDTIYPPSGPDPSDSYDYIDLLTPGYTIWDSTFRRLNATDIELRLDHDAAQIITIKGFLDPVTGEVAEPNEVDAVHWYDGTLCTSGMIRDALTAAPIGAAVDAIYVCQ